MTTEISRYEDTGNKKQGNMRRNFKILQGKSTSNRECLYPRKGILGRGMEHHCQTHKRRGARKRRRGNLLPICQNVVHAFGSYLFFYLMAQHFMTSVPSSSNAGTRIATLISYSSQVRRFLYLCTSPKAESMNSYTTGSMSTCTWNLDSGTKTNFCSSALH